MDDYFSAIWKEIGEEKRKSFKLVDSLLFSMYNVPTFKDTIMSWIKKKNILSKKYVLVPTVFCGHWALLILCNFNEELETRNQCMILLDSLKAAGHPIQPDIRKFVLDLLISEEKLIDKATIMKIPLLIPKVPQQKRDDCGSFVLYFSYLFMNNAPEVFSHKNGYPYFMKKDWFTHDMLTTFKQRMHVLKEGGHVQADGCKMGKDLGSSKSDGVLESPAEPEAQQITKTGNIRNGCNQNEIPDKPKHKGDKRKGELQPSPVSKDTDESVKTNKFPRLTTINNEPDNNKAASDGLQTNFVSEFRGVDVIRQCQHQYHRLLWQNVSDKISQTSIDSISSIKEDINIIIAEMKTMDSMNSAPLEALILELFDRARRYDLSRSSVCEMMTKEAYFGYLSRAKEQLENIKANKEAAITRLNALDVKIETIEETEKEIELLRMDLEKQKQQVQSSMQQDREEMVKMQEEEISKKEEIYAIETTSFQSDKILQDLEEARGSFEASRQNLINFNFMIS